MERIRKINKLLLITYNLGGICLMMIGAMVGVPGPPGYVPMGIKIATGISLFFLCLCKDDEIDCVSDTGL